MARKPVSQERIEASLGAIDSGLHNKLYRQREGWPYESGWDVGGGWPPELIESWYTLANAADFMTSASLRGSANLLREHSLVRYEEHRLPQEIIDQHGIRAVGRVTIRGIGWFYKHTAETRHLHFDLETLKPRGKELAVHAVGLYLNEGPEGDLPSRDMEDLLKYIDRQIRNGPMDLPDKRSKI